MAPSSLVGPGSLSRVPVDVVGLASGVAAICAGFDFTCALSVAGGSSAGPTTSTGNGTTSETRVKLAAPMLVAQGARGIGLARLHWALGFSRRLGWLIVSRTGLVLDTRYAPGSQAPARPNACVYFFLAGELTIHDGVPVAAPAAFVLTEEQLEGAGGVRRWTYRTAGSPFVTIQVNLPASLVRVATSAAPAPLHLDAATWRAAERAAALVGDVDAARAPMTELLLALVAGGVLAPEVAELVTTPSPAAVALLWRGLRPMIERLYLNPTVAEVSGALGVSERQVDRQLRAFVARFGHIGTGWRPTTKHLRLKLATMFLSAAGVSIAEVAAAVGYGSTDAMARAFRDARMPTPSHVKDALQSGTDDVDR